MESLHQLADYFGGVLLASGGGAGPNPTSELMTTIMMFGMIFLVFYFLVIRPQSKRQKEHAAMLSALKRGDEVITAGGVHGVIKAVTPHTVKVEIAPNVVVTIDKPQISGVRQGSSSDDTARGTKDNKAEDTKEK